MNNKFHIITAIFLSVILFSFFSNPIEGHAGPLSDQLFTLADSNDCITSGGFYFNQNPVNCSVSSLENLCFDLPESTHQDVLSVCDTTIELTNPLWYNFIAGDSLFHILAEIDNCAQGNGLKVAVFELDCAQHFESGSEGVLPDGSFLLTDCSWLLNPQVGELEIELDLVVGKAYGLMIDGWEGDRCQFEVTEVIRAGDAPELDDDLGEISYDEVLGPPTCVIDETVIFFIENKIPGACTYVWTKEDLNSGEFEIIQNSDLIEVSIHFNDYGHYNFCVAASNICDTTDFVCIEIQILSPDPFFTVDTICKRTEYNWIGPFGEVLLHIPPGDSVGDFQFDTIAVNQEGCEVESFLNLHIIDDNIDDKTPISAVICLGQGYQMPDGQIFTATGFYGEDNSIFITQSSEPGATYQCDSFFTLDLIVLDILMFWDDPVCVNNQIFIFPDTIISYNPFLLPGFGGEELGWQLIRASDGTTISSKAIGPLDSLDGFFTLDKDLHFTQDIETFEWHVQMTFNGEPEETCQYIAGFIRIDFNDFRPNIPFVQGPTIAEVDTEISFEITNAPQDSIPTILYHWEISADSNDYTIINGSPGSVLDIVFHSVGEYEICVTGTNECGEGEPHCFTVVIDTDVSTGELLTEQKEVNVFPNPVEEYLIIQSKDLKGEIDITIFDSAGKLVKFNSIQHDHQSHLDVSGLSAGIYFIRIHQGGEVLKKQFVKK